MKFNLGDKYIVVCTDLLTNVCYSWHLDFYPWKKAYLIIEEKMEVNTIFRERYFIHVISKVESVSRLEAISDSANTDYWRTCPVCGDYLGEGLCQSCHGFDWDSYKDND